MRILALVLTALHAACTATPPPPSRVSSDAERDLAAARARHAASPRDEDAIVWLGRRLGYVERFEEAVEVFSRGLEIHPDSARLLRFRGHRWITLRRFDDAVRDLERAELLLAGRPDEVEPDGRPNAAGIPRTTLHGNVDYHLALAHHLRGDFARAVEVHERGAGRARGNDDRLVSHAYWHALALLRLGRDAEARAVLEPVRADGMELLENEDYRELGLMLKGERDPDAVLAAAERGTTAYATRAYGVGCAKLHAGDREGALAVWREVVASGPKAAFGCIAAEAKLGRKE